MWSDEKTTVLRRHEKDSDAAGFPVTAGCPPPVKTEVQSDSFPSAAPALALQVHLIGVEHGVRIEHRSSSLWLQVVAGGVRKEAGMSTLRVR
jgi:hypothetical protein